MQVGLRLLDAHQRHQTFENPWLEKRGKDAGGPDRPVRHRVRPDTHLWTAVALAHLNGDITARKVPVHTLNPRGDGRKIGVEALLDARMLRVEGAEHIAEMLATASEVDAF